MIYQEQHEAFKRLAVQQGIGTRAQLDTALPFGHQLPAHLLDRWLNRLLQVPKEFSSPRFVNRFRLGADPEFVFMDHGERLDAQHLGLAQGLAFGMDNNGRLTEIRPYPSRSAVRVVASILATLRWMAIMKPQTSSLAWVAGAFVQGDGLGGHVHFGRKRPGRSLEIKALDMMDEELMAIGAYPTAEVARRRAGDQHHQLYGHPGDFRKQLHGYEYRTFPSWLDSPELAFLTLVLSKLAVHNPGLTQGYVPFTAPDRHYQRVKNLLSCYKDVDDDARLALQMVSRRWPVHVGGDFKERWGFTGGTLVPSFPSRIGYVPACIKPSEDIVDEVFLHIRDMKPLQFVMPQATWSPTALPADYESALRDANTHQAKGLGELLWDVCKHKSFKYFIVNERKPGCSWFFSVPRSLAAIFPQNWKHHYGRKIGVREDEERYIGSIEHNRGLETFREAKALLTESVLPYWKISEVKPDSFQQWQASRREFPATSRYAGQILAGNLSALPNGRIYK